MSKRKGKPMTQAEFIRNYSDKYRYKFNKDIFYRDDNDIIEELKKVILACQRNASFTIRVDKFTVVDDYIEVRNILRKYEADRLKPGNVNRYDYISLKESTVKLLIVDYFIATHKDGGYGETDNLQVIIQVPKIVDGKYYKIFGSMYSPTYQIIESTYNNTASASSKSRMVVMKTLFMASRFYQYNIADSKEFKLKTVNDEYLDGVYYQSNIFSKFVHPIRYLLAKFGLTETLRKLKVHGLVITEEDPKDPNMYTISIHKKDGLYMSIPKFIYDKDHVAQSTVYTIAVALARPKNKDVNIQNIYTIDYWVGVLSETYSSIKDAYKGLSVLESLECIYDKSSQEHLGLPDEDKEDIYDIIVWVMREFHALRLKDNLDISMKRIRDGEYVALLYAIKVTKGIFRISDKSSKVSTSAIKKSLNTYPDFLLKAITKDRLINYRGSVNDLDSIAAAKFSFKGVSGIGDNDNGATTSSSVPAAYRMVAPSHLGRLDLTSVSSTDPGLTGMLVPTVELHNWAFSDKSEPNTWKEWVDSLLMEYREQQGLLSILELQEQTGLTKKNSGRKRAVKENLEASKVLINVANVAENGEQL